MTVTPYPATTSTLEPRDLAWPEEIDEILAGDLVVAVASPTTRGGVVLNSVTPLGMRDRVAGTVSFTTSLGFGRKLERIAHDPRMGVAYHTRQHGHSDTRGFVLIQGTAAIRPAFTDDELRGLAERAGRHVGQLVEGRFWDWWLQVYYRDRVGVDVAVRRILWWRSGAVDEVPVVLGDPLPTGQPPSQEPPRNARTPRVSARRIRRALTKDHQLIGVLQADGMPLILPVEGRSAGAHGVSLAVRCPLLLQGGRRAGLLAHSFRAQLLGLSTATGTGWLEVGDEVAWTPHTMRGFTAPPNKTLLLLGNGAAARWGYRKAVRQGREEILRHLDRDS
jgi:hypothetical protein